MSRPSPPSAGAGRASSGQPPSPSLFVLQWVLANKRKVLGGASAAALAYLAYKAYHSESASQLGKLKKSVQDWAGALSSASSTTALVLSDLHAFLNSDADELPRSLRQLNKLVQSSEVQTSVACTITSMGTALQRMAPSDTSASGQVLPQIIEAVLSDRGRTLVGMAVGLATKNATTTVCEFLERAQRHQAANADGQGVNSSLQVMLELLASDQGEKVISLLITKSIKTAVSTYVDATTGYNYYEDMVASVAKQDHREAVTDIMTKVTAAFCRELAYAYRLTQQRTSQSFSSGGAATAPSPLLSNSCNSSSTTSVVSLAGHTGATADQPSKSSQPINRRHSHDEQMLMAAAAARQPRSAGGDSTASTNSSGLVQATVGIIQSRMHHGGVPTGRPISGNGTRTPQQHTAQQQQQQSPLMWIVPPAVSALKEQHMRSLAVELSSSCTREMVSSAIQTVWGCVMDSWRDSRVSQALSGTNANMFVLFVVCAMLAMLVPRALVLV